MEGSSLSNFIDDNFLLNNDKAIEVFNKYAKDMPIFDYHCHLNPKEILEDKKFTNITEAWLNGDHYKWRAMRSNGITEDYITGQRSDYEKFEAWAETMPYLIGNPLYSWTHLELKRYFGIDEILCKENAKIIWEKANKILDSKDFTARAIIKKSKVRGICTTDDPTDSLEYHEKIVTLNDFETKVLPTFRPDKALEINNSIFEEWVSKLSEVSGATIKSYDEFLEHLEGRVLYFHERGCRISDHSLGCVFYKKGTLNEVKDIFTKALKGENVNVVEEEKFKTYTLNPNYNYILATMAGNFAGDGITGKIQFGTAWWFNDNKDGMETQIKALANLGVLGRFVGMLTDSRSFLSYTRHEYFRRILCNMVGQWVENGEFPDDNATLEMIIKGICFNNAKDYFGIEL